MEQDAIAAGGARDHGIGFGEAVRVWARMFMMIGSAIGFTRSPWRSKRAGICHESEDSTLRKRLEHGFLHVQPVFGVLDGEAIR